MRPLALRLLDSAAATVDRAFVGAMQLRNRSARAAAESLSHADRMASLARIERTYGAPGLLANPDAFFPPPPAVTPTVRFVRDLGWGGQCLELSWPSAFEPFDARFGSRYLAHVPNRTAHARFYGVGG